MQVFLEWRQLVNPFNKCITYCACKYAGRMAINGVLTPLPKIPNRFFSGYPSKRGISMPFCMIGQNFLELHDVQYFSHFFCQRGEKIADFCTSKYFMHT